MGGLPSLHAVIAEAARRAFPEAPPAVVVGEPGSWKTNPGRSLVLLVTASESALGDLGPPDAATAGLAEWPVVRLGIGGRPDDPEVVPPEDWNAGVLARVFRSAVSEHRLRRENARARADLLTVGRRITHDLRTPLGGAIASVDLLHDVLSDQGSPHLPLIQPLYDSMRDLERVIERAGFLATASAVPVPKAAVPMGESVLAALDKLEGRILASGAVVNEPPDWPTVQGVAAWLEVVWCNLLANAVQHGGIGVQIDLGWAPSGNGHSFWVRDRGVGVAPERRGRLFHPFERLHEPGAARGFGLPMVRRLVELQGGQCRYEPVPEGGSCFIFSLPLS